MSNHGAQPNQHSCELVTRAHLHAVGWVIAVGLLGTGAITVASMCLGDALPLKDLVTISIASVVIAVASMLPGMMMNRRHPQPASGRPSPAPWDGFLGGLVAGIVIRLAGTVALFLTCRYHMATSTETIAAVTIGWYVLLTTLEVFVLSRELPETAKAPNFPETSLG